MIYVDIVKFHGKPFSLGFQKVLHIKEVNAIDVQGNEEAAEKAFRNKKIEIVFGCESLKERDSFSSRGSVLTSALLQLAQRNKIAVGFSFNNLIKVKPDRRAVILGRMIQNVAWCRKFNVKMVIASLAESPYSMRSVYEVIAFGQLLRMHPSEAQKAVSFERKKSGVKEV